MPPGIGYGARFQPGSQNSQQQGDQGTPLQSAIKLLSLRLPTAAPGAAPGGAGPGLAPQPLLQGGGGAGQPANSFGFLQAILAALGGQRPGFQSGPVGGSVSGGKFPGGFPTGGAPAPNIKPGAQGGIGSHNNPPLPYPTGGVLGGGGFR